MPIQNTPQTTKKAQQEKAASPHKQSEGESAFSVEGDIQRAAFNLTTAQPNDILQLQRRVGNRVVNAMIQQHTQTSTVQPKLMVGPAGDRYEREADQTAKQVMRMQTPVAMRRTNDEQTAQRKSIQRSTKNSEDGFAADKNFTRQLNTSKGGGKSLPNETRSFMESRFNTDFSGVRIHTGNDAAQMNYDIQAKAFTHGRDIYFNRDSYAPGSGSGKELLAHELTHVVQQGAAVQRAPNGETPTIQRKNDGLIQRSFGSWLKGKFSKKKEADKGSGSTAKTPNPEALDPTNVPAKDELRDDAAIYERNLGRVAFNHSKANSAAKMMMDKMTSVLIGDLEADNVDQEKQLVATYGSDKVSSAGQVGKNVKALLAVLKEGNLRERMTALMNAMFGPFKQYVLKGMQDASWGEMQKKGLNVDKLKRRKRQMRWNPGAKDLFRDPGNPLDRKNLSTFQHTGKTRFDKQDAVAQTSQRTVGDLEQGKLSIGLSQREKDLQFPNQPDDQIANEKLKWMEGGTYWAVNHKNKWVKKVEDSLHMPILAGPSGTMLRMFQTWEYLNKPVSAEDWRLAVMGWMLSANDHSFHEMMLTAADYGLPYTPGPMAYMNIPPLSLMELRNYVAEDGLFPHEHAMTRKVQSGNIKHLLEDDDLKSGDKAAKDLDEDQRGALSGPGAAAINLYTRFGYLVLNPARKGGMLANKQVERNAKKKDEMSQFKDDFENGKLTADELMKEAGDIIPVLDSALETMPDWSGELFRGTGTFSPFSYRKGATVKFGAYTSSTLDKSVAKDFANDYNIGPFKYILHLNTTAGKDVRELSDANEDEILIPPGSVFEVTDRIPPKSGRAYYHVHLKQTARGGMGLKLKPDKDSLIGSGIKVEEKGVVSTKPTVLKEITLDCYIDACNEAGKSIGSVRPGETIGATGVKNGALVQYVWEGTTYWMNEVWWDMYFGTPYPEAGMEDASVDDPSLAVSSVSSPPTTDDSVSTIPKLDKLTVYDHNDLPVDTLSDPSQIAVDDVSTITGKDGVEWTEIGTTAGPLYWTKTAELMAFLGKEYKPKESGVQVVSDSPVDNSPKVTAVEEESPVKEVSDKGSGKPKLDSLTLYNADDVAIDVLDSASEISDSNSSSYTDDKGLLWIEIITKSGDIYWVKGTELAAFL